MARKVNLPEVITIRLPAGALAEIGALLLADETQADAFREAIGMWKAVREQAIRHEVSQHMKARADVRY